eukprot:Rmarinus@m.2547
MHASSRGTEGCASRPPPKSRSHSVTSTHKDRNAIKFQFDILCRELVNYPKGKSVVVQWSRGMKVATTKVSKDYKWNEVLSIVATLNRDPRTQQLEQKTTRLSIKEQLPGRTNIIGSVNLNLAAYVDFEGGSQEVSLPLFEHNKVSPLLKVSISSIWLRGTDSGRGSIDTHSEFSDLSMAASDAVSLANSDIFSVDYEERAAELAHVSSKVRAAMKTITGAGGTAHRQMHPAADGKGAEKIPPVSPTKPRSAPMTDAELMPPPAVRKVSPPGNRTDGSNSTSPTATALASSSPTVVPSMDLPPQSPTSRAPLDPSQFLPADQASRLTAMEGMLAARGLRSPSLSHAAAQARAERPPQSPTSSAPTLVPGLAKSEPTSPTRNRDSLIASQSPSSPMAMNGVTSIGLLSSPRHVRRASTDGIPSPGADVNLHVDDLDPAVAVVHLKKALNKAVTEKNAAISRWKMDKDALQGQLGHMVDEIAKLKLHSRLWGQEKERLLEEKTVAVNNNLSSEARIRDLNMKIVQCEQDIEYKDIDLSTLQADLERLRTEKEDLAKKLDEERAASVKAAAAQEKSVAAQKALEKEAKLLKEELTKQNHKATDAESSEADAAVHVAKKWKIRADSLSEELEDMKCDVESLQDKLLTSEALAKSEKQRMEEEITRLEKSLLEKGREAESAAKAASRSLSDLRESLQVIEKDNARLAARVAELEQSEPPTTSPSLRGSRSRTLSMSSVSADHPTDRVTAELQSRPRVSVCDTLPQWKEYEAPGPDADLLPLSEQLREIRDMILQRDDDRQIIAENPDDSCGLDLAGYIRYLEESLVEARIGWAQAECERGHGYVKQEEMRRQLEKTKQAYLEAATRMTKLEVKLANPERRRFSFSGGLKNFTMRKTDEELASVDSSEEPAGSRTSGADARETMPSCLPARPLAAGRKRSVVDVMKGMFGR